MHAREVRWDSTGPEPLSGELGSELCFACKYAFLGCSFQCVPDGNLWFHSTSYSLMSWEGSTGQNKLILVSDLPRTKASPTLSVAATHSVIHKKPHDWSTMRVWCIQLVGRRLGAFYPQLWGCGIPPSVDSEARPSEFRAQPYCLQLCDRGLITSRGSVFSSVKWCL